MKNTMKKFLSLVLAVLMLVSVVPMGASAANAYTINGKTVRYTDFSSSPDDCWNYANNIYNKIWGQRFSNSFNDNNNSLRNLNDSQLTLNATNLKNYVSHAALGSCLRICNADYLHGTDGWGHSQIIVQKDGNGFTVFEGGLTASPHNREKYYTWNEYCSTGWLGGTYKYIKYIKWPGASAYSATVPEPTTILYPTSGATYKIASGVGNNMYLDFACSSDNVQIYENCDGHSNPDFVKSQYFKLTHVGDGWYTVVNVGNGKAMDVDNWTPDPTTNVHQYDLHSGDNQLFRFYDAGNGYCYIKSKLGCYLDVQNGDSVNNANVWMYTFNESTAQKWKLEKKDVPSFDTQKPSITNVKISDVSSTGYTVTCNVSDNVGVARVAFPTWTTSNGQDDLMWKDGTTSGNTATFRVNTSDHKNEIGEYVTDIYAYDVAGNHGYTGSFVVVVPEPDTQKPSISNVRVTDINESGFTISCEVYDNVEIKQVFFPVWTPEYLFPSSKLEGQDDIIYHEATLNGNTATCRINIADHYNSYGQYFCDPHVYDTSDNCLISSRIYIQVPKIVAKNEQLAPLGVYNLSENNTIGISGWAFNLTGERVDCYYQFDNDEETKFENANRPDVYEFHEGCKQIDCGYGGNISILDLSEGKHTVRIIAKTGNASQILFSNEFTVIVPTFTIYFNANSGQCSTASKSVKFNSSYGSLPTPTRNGHTFDGWYTSAVDGTKITSSTKVTTTGDLTLYAHWTCNHSSTEIKNSKTATCTAEGYTGDTYCKTCEIKIQPGTAIAKLAHTYKTSTTKAATCTKAGTKTFTCVCGDTYTETIAKLGHKYSSSYTTDTPATCTTDGSKSKHCTRSGCTAKADVTAIAKLAHTYKTTITKATLSKNGKVVEKCSVCGNVKSTTTVYYPKTFTLSTTTYTYNGKERKPSVTVKDSKGNTLKKDTDYTVKYADGRKNTGKYSVVVTFKGKYSGTKTLYFNILPSKTSKITPTCSTTSIKATWSKVTGASGYKVELLNSKGKVVKSATTTSTSYTFKSLSKVTTYKVRVTAYKTIDKKAVYSTVSTTITTSTAPATVTLSKVTAGSKSATPTWKTVSGASGYQVMYSTSSKFSSSKTATVSKGSSTKTTIKSLTKGKTYYFKVRAYKTVDGNKVYGAWSSVKSVKVK